MVPDQQQAPVVKRLTHPNSSTQTSTDIIFLYNNNNKISCRKMCGKCDRYNGKNSVINTTNTQTQGNRHTLCREKCTWTWNNRAGHNPNQRFPQQLYLGVEIIIQTTIDNNNRIILKQRRTWWSTYFVIPLEFFGNQRG